MRVRPVAVRSRIVAVRKTSARPDRSGGCIQKKSPREDEHQAVHARLGLSGVSSTAAFSLLPEAATCLASRRRALKVLRPKDVDIIENHQPTRRPRRSPSGGAGAGRLAVAKLHQVLSAHCAPVARPGSVNLTGASPSDCVRRYWCARAGIRRCSEAVLPCTLVIFSGPGANRAPILMAIVEDREGRSRWPRTSDRRRVADITWSWPLKKTVPRR